MDQFIVENPDYFFSRSPEHCRVNPDNLLILMHHIKSAAFELPFEKGERFGGENLEELLDYLEQKGVLHRVGGMVRDTEPPVVGFTTGEAGVP